MIMMCSFLNEKQYKYEIEIFLVWNWGKEDIKYYDWIIIYNYENLKNYIDNYDCFKGKDQYIYIYIYIYIVTSSVKNDNLIH